MINTSCFKFTFYFLFVLNLSFGQQKLIDSLQKRVFETKTDHKKYSLYNVELAEALCGTDKISIAIVEKSLINLENSTDYKIKSKIYSIASKVYGSFDNYEKMIKFSNLSMQAANKTNDNATKANAYLRKSFVLLILNDKKQMDSFFQTLKFAEKAKDNFILSKCYYFICCDYHDLNNIVLENKYARLCLKTALASKNAEALSYAWQAMAGNLSDKYNKKKSKTTLDSILICYRKGIQEFKKRKGYVLQQSQLSILYLNTANHFYVAAVPVQKDSAKHYLKLALEESIRTSQNQVESYCYGFLSQIEYENNNYDEVERLLKKALLNNETRKLKSNVVSMKINKELSNFYTIKKDYSTALKYKDEYIKYYEASFDIEQQKNSQLNDAKYELKKNQESIKLLDEKNKSITREKYFYYLISAALLLSLFFMFLTYNYRLKLSVTKQKVLEEKTKLKTEEALRLLVEQDLILVQKEQLQKELLAGEVQVEHKNELLKNIKGVLLKENVSEKAIHKMTQIIKGEYRIDKDFESIKKEFKDIDPDFFKKLKEQCKTKLTKLDLKYCSYIKLNLSTKQMATLLNVEPASIRVNKYRLKLKFGLSKEDDLFEYLNVK